MVGTTGPVTAMSEPAVAVLGSVVGASWRGMRWKGLTSEARPRGRRSERGKAEAEERRARRGVTVVVRIVDDSVELALVEGVERDRRKNEKE